MALFEKLSHLTTFLFDIDGVFTASGMLATEDGELLRTVNTRDGLAVKMVAQFFKAIRPINLAIVGGYQYIIYYKYILSIVENPRLSPLHFLGFVVTTLLVTAGGYLINDYYDHEGDLINKTNWHKLNKSTLWNAYIVVTLLGFIIALWIAYQIRHLSYAGIYAFAVALLYVYSAWAKRQALIGNIIVAAFSGLSILVLLLTEWPALTIVMTISPTGYWRDVNLCIFCIVDQRISQGCRRYQR